MKSYNTLDECLLNIKNKKDYYIFYQTCLNKNYSIGTLEEIKIFQKKKKCNIFEYVNYETKIKFFFYIYLTNNNECFDNILNNIINKLHFNLNDLIIIQETDLKFRIIHKYLHINNYDICDEYLFKFSIHNIHLEKYTFIPSILNNDIIINEKYNFDDSILNNINNTQLFDTNTINITQFIKYDKYIDKIQFTNCNTIFIKSSMGSGKSTATVKYIKDNNINTFLIFSCRRTLTYTIYDKLKECNIDVDNYLLNKNNIKSSKKLIISPDSICNLDFPLYKFDFIWIDEGVSFMYYIGNYLYTNINKRKNIQVIIEWLLKNCKKLLITDADFNLNIIHYYLYFRTINKSIYIIYNNETIQNKYNLYDNEDNILNNIKKDILNERKLYICCDTLKKTKTIYNFINTLIIQKQILLNINDILLYNSECQSKYDKMMYNVNKFWIQYKIIIVSPKVVFGVDINIENLYIVNGFYKCTTLTVRESIQQLNRIRNIKMKTINILIYKKKQLTLSNGLVNIKSCIEQNIINNMFYKKTHNDINNIISNIEYNIDNNGYKYIDMSNNINYLLLYTINETNNNLNSFLNIFLNKIKYIHNI